ncbi:MAG TPA: hypothetical protein VGO58_15465 [Chitinophagaceae bacterium]|jgi:hypothetical protein|nr:hypothetical protein [Chitinophagaceae bacterium]
MSDKYQDSHDKDCGCNDNESRTKTDEAIKKERDKLCTDLFDSAGVVAEYESKVKDLKILKGLKNCSFTWSEEYYHYYRDLSLGYGSKLLQSSESIKESVKNNTATAKLLSETLKAICKATGDVSTKVKDLGEEAFRLNGAMNHDCNCAAMTIITGKRPDKGNCPDPGPPPGNSKPCDEGSHKLDTLVAAGDKLVNYICKIYKSASDVSGIQAFSSITTIDKAQSDLNDIVKKFDTHIQDSIKKGETGVKNSYQELGKVVQEISKAYVGRYDSRSKFEGLYDASKDICCNQCDCIRDKNCAEEICTLCKKVLPCEKEQAATAS